MKKISLSILLVLFTPFFASAASCPNITIRLSSGTSHTQVISLKKFLVAEGVMGANSYTTYFGPLTQAALQKWQCKKGIVCSGTPSSTGYGATGPMTRAALKNCMGANAAQSSSALDIGSRGEAVFALQRMLILAKLLSADSLTGYYGPLTKEAHRRFLESANTSSGGSSGVIVTNNNSSVNPASGPQLYGWVTGGWSSCVNSTQSRGVTCQSSTGAVVSDMFCPLQKPATTQSCSANSGNQSCTLGTQTVAHGGSVVAYQNTSVAAGQTCASISETRICTNGTLSGSYTQSTCSVGTTNSAPCVLDGVSVAQGASRTFYSARTVAAGQSCANVSQSRTCTNGRLGGSDAYQYAVCAEQQNSQACLFNGQSVAHGASVTAYQSDTIPSGQTCAAVSQTRTCSNGVLSGTYTAASCSVSAPPSNASCTFNGQSVAHGNSVTAYQSSSVSGGTCASVAQSRTCTNGSLSGTYAYASCTVSAQTAPTSIRMTDYFPTGPLTKVYKKADGSEYLRHVIDPVDPRVSLTPQTKSGTHYVLHDWIGGYYADTWHMLNGTDGSVSEITDSFAATTGCTAPCYGRMAAYYGEIIGHGPAGNMSVSSPAFIQNNVQMWYSPDGIVQPSYRDDMRAWSDIKLVAIHATYTPEYGSNNGAFHAGGGKAYSNVIEVLFGHGTKYDGLVEPSCANQPASTPHRAGYSSFWQRAWLAPGVGWIKIENLYYEPSCAGTLTDPGSGAWTAYIDTVTASLPYSANANCVNPAPQVVTNSCQEVGYPAGYSGSYTSTRQLSCATGQYSDWVRTDTCHP